MNEAQKLKQNASRYFKNIFEFLLVTRVTGCQGEEISLDEGGDQAAQMILTVLAGSNKAMLIGNGGSAALASHTHNDLIKSVKVPSLVFTEVPILTALTNDDGYAVAFEQQVDLWAKPGDLLVVISSSGRSENILRAAQAARRHGCCLITLSGFHPDNPLRILGDLNFYVPAEDYGYVESVHAVLLHFITDQAIIFKNIKMR